MPHEQRPSEPRYDVAVIGGGPVGATAAHLFGRAGWKTLLVEKQTEPFPLPRAVHLDHEMMRIFQDLGLSDTLGAMMRATHGHVHIGADGGVIRYLGAHGRPKKFGWANDYFFYQPELEAALRQALACYPNVELRLGCEMTALKQDEHGVRLDLASSDAGASSVTTRFVVACDGARSTVRQALGVKLDDLHFEEPWLVIDAELDEPVVFPAFDGLPPDADLQNLSVMLCDPRRPGTIVPGRGSHRRWEFMLLPGESDDAMMAPARVAELIAPYVAGRPHRIVRATTYRFHGLVAESWRVGRVLLAGDAAHQTPPFFGQGMCHGLRDVASLAWKLGLILAGAAPCDLLQTYQAERDPHVRAVIGAAVEAGRYICLLNPAAAAARDARLRAAAQNAAPSTAADLIPRLTDGIVSLGGGERFIQPRVADRDGRTDLLDTITGGGFRLFTDVSLPDALPPASRAVLDTLEIKVFRLGVPGQSGADLHDVEGELGRWLAERGASAVVLRPDFYVYGLAADAEELCTLLSALGSQVGLLAAHASPPLQLESVP